MESGFITTFLIQVGDNRCLLQSLKDSPYYRSFQDKVRSKTGFGFILGESNSPPDYRLKKILSVLTSVQSVQFLSSLCWN